MATPEIINRRCPQCGRKAYDRLLVQCPDCHVPFVEGSAPAQTELSPEQIDLITRLILGSWKFWAVVVILVAGAACGIVLVANHVIETKSKDYLNTFGAQASNQLGSAFGQITNRIAAEFRQPKIQATIEQVAQNRAGDIFDNGVRPSVEAFANALDQANAQLIRSSNLVAQLEAEALAAQRRIPPPISNTPTVQTASAPVTQTTTPSTVLVPPAPVSSNSTNSAPSGVKLQLVNQNVSPAGGGYVLTLNFRLGNGSSAGMVDMAVGTWKQTAKILNFAAAGSTAVPVFNDLSDAADLRFNVSTQQPATLVLQVSAPTIVQFTSDALDPYLTIPIAADKMQVPPASR